MIRVLDELADALWRIHGRPLPRRIVPSVELRELFSPPITPGRWSALAKELACPLPELQSLGGVYRFPKSWKTVWDLASLLARCHPEWQPPLTRTAIEWQEAQIFVGVRETLSEALSVSVDEVVRPARLMADLGAE